MYSKIRFAHPLEWCLKLNNKLYNNYPLLEIKDFGPPTTYGEDKELKLNEKTTPLPIPLSWGWGQYSCHAERSISNCETPIITHYEN